MSLTSTSRPAIRGRVLARIPAKLAARNGFKLEKDNGTWTIEPDFAQLSVVSSLDTPEQKQVWAYDPNTGEYVVVSLQGLIDSLPEGPPVGVRQAFSSATADADPGNGKFRLNHATPASATAAYLDDLDAQGASVAAIVDSFDASSNSIKGRIRFDKIGDPSVFAEFDVTQSVVDGTGYRKLTLADGVAGGSFASDDAFAITFFRAGNAGATGATGKAAGLAFTWSSDTANSDPSSGKVKVNNATMAAVTALYISETDSDGNALAALLATWDDSTNTHRGQIKISKVGAPSNFAAFNIIGTLADNGGWDTFIVAHVASGGALANDDAVTLEFSRSGDKGADGAGVGDLIAANNLSDLASRKTGYDNLSVHGADVASAATIDLDSASGVLIDITGTTAISAITLANGRERVVRFTGALTLTHGASLVLPGGGNITTAAGDFAVFRGYAAGVVRCVDYTRADGQPLNATMASLASAATVDLGSVPSQRIGITGTTTITSFGSSAAVGAVKLINFTGALTLTYHATSLILPGGGNIVTAAGDALIAAHEGSGNWRVLGYFRGAGRALTTGVADTIGTIGFAATPTNAGTKSSGTFTPDPASGNFQYATNGGAHTLAPPSAACTMILEYTNNGSAGALTTSSFTKVTGDTLTTTNGHKFFFFITRHQSFSHLHVQALQ